MPYQRGSGFIGLQQYLGANQGAAQRMGGQIVADLEHSVKDAENEINAGVTEFNAQAAAGTPQYNEDADRGFGYLFGNSARGGHIAYSGPHTLNDVANTEYLGGRVGAVGKQAALAGTDAGRATLLQQRYGQNYTSTGGRSLDAFLSGVGAGEGLANPGKAMTGLKAYLGNAVSGTEARAAQGTAEATALSDRYKREHPETAPAFSDDTRRATIPDQSTPDHPVAPPGIGFNSGAQTAAGRTLNITTGLPITSILGTFGIGKKKRR